MSKFIICITVTGPPGYSYPMSCKQDSFPNVLTPQKYKGLKNHDGVIRLYSFHLLVGLIGQLLYPECKDGPMLLHKHKWY